MKKWQVTLKLKKERKKTENFFQYIPSKGKVMRKTEQIPFEQFGEQNLISFRKGKFRDRREGGTVRHSKLVIDK